MTPLLAPIAGRDLLAQLDAHGWAQGDWETDDGRICAHQAIRLCAPVPGDARLIKQVATAQGWGTGWNDDPATTEADVRRRLGAGVAVTDDELEGVFGPQWRAVVSLVHRAAVLTPAEVMELGAAGYAARDTAGYAARDAAWGAARDAAWGGSRDAAWDVVGGAAFDAARDAAWGAAGDAAWGGSRDAAWGAVGGVVTWHLATDDGPYSTTQRDLLMAPWASVCGLPEGLVKL